MEIIVTYSRWMDIPQKNIILISKTKKIILKIKIITAKGKQSQQHEKKSLNHLVYSRNYRIYNNKATFKIHEKWRLLW